MASATIISQGGNINVTGTGGSGTIVSTGATISSGGIGSVTITGNSKNSGPHDNSVYLLDSFVTSTNGPVLVIGQASGSNPGSNPAITGVFIAGGQLSAGGNGSVTVQGSGGSQAGVLLLGYQISTNVYSNGVITSGGGNVLVSGTGVTSNPGNNNVYGVLVDTGGIVTAGGNGNVAVVGTGGVSSGFNIGVYVANANSGIGPLTGAIITSGGGDVQVTGFGGDIAGQSQGDYGIDVGKNGEVSAGGNGQVTVQGIGGGARGSFNDGVRLESGVITSNGGNVQISGTANGTSSFGLNLNKSFNSSISATITAPSGGNLSIQSDSVLLSAGSINAGSRALTLIPQTSGTLIDIGGADGTGALGLTNAELGLITAGTLNIGDANSGAITVSSAISLASATNVKLTSGSNIIFNPGMFNTAGGSLNLVPGSTGSVQPLSAGTDVTSGSANLTFATGANLSIAINGTTPDTQYTQFTVAGNVNLSGANLVLSGTLTPAIGQAFTIVNNQGTKPIIGVFNGLPEGAVIPNFLGSGQDATISYTGGDGNDVVVGIPGTFSKFVDTVFGGNTVVAGSPFLFTVQAADQAGIPVIGYSGPTSVTTTLGPADPLGNFPVAGNLQSGGAGFGFFLGDLQTAGTYTLTTSGGGFSGSSSPITVIPAGASYFTVAGPMTASTGGSFSVTVTAHDPYGNVENDYTGTVQLAGAAALGTPYSFTTGAGKTTACIPSASRSTQAVVKQSRPPIRPRRIPPLRGPAVRFP